MWTIFHPDHMYSLTNSEHIIVIMLQNSVATLVSVPVSGATKLSPKWADEVMTTDPFLFISLEWMNTKKWATCTPHRALLWLNYRIFSDTCRSAHFHNTNTVMLGNCNVLPWSQPILRMVACLHFLSRIYNKIQLRLKETSTLVLSLLPQLYKISGESLWEWLSSAMLKVDMTTDPYCAQLLVFLWTALHTCFWHFYWQYNISCHLSNCDSVRMHLL